MKNFTSKTKISILSQLADQILVVLFLIILMISTIIWNVRGINTQGVLERLKILRKFHQLSIITILEPFSNSVQIQNFKIFLNMDNAISNYNGKIWVFWTVMWTVTFLMRMNSKSLVT